jgi:iron(III) transport system permease protein
MSTQDGIRVAIRQAVDSVTARGLSAKRVVLGSIVLTVAVLTLVPLAFLVWTSLWAGYPGQLDGFVTFEHFRAVYLEGFFDIPDLFVNSLTIAIGMTLTGMAFGLTFAWLFVRTNLPTKGKMELVLLSGQAIPGYVYGIMYITAYGPDRGFFSVALADLLGIKSIPISIFNPWGIAFIAGINVVSTFYLLVVPALQDMDSALEGASRIHGASIIQTIRSITFPLIKPAILSAVITTFLYGMGEFAIVSFLGARRGFDVYATEIAGAIKSRFPAAHGEAAALALSLLLITIVFVYYYRQVTKRKEDFMTLTGQRTEPQTWDLGRWRLPLTVGLWIVLILVWVLPILALVATSLHTTWAGQIKPAQMTLTHYVTAFTNPELRGAFTNSVLVAVGSATLGTVLVVGLAYYTERTKARLRGFVDFLSLTPLAVPGIILGAGLISMFLWLGKLPFLNLYGTLMIIIIGSVIVFIPVSSRMALGNIVQIHKEMEEAARVAGASWLQQMREIFLPLFRNTTIVLWFFLAVHIFQLLSIPWMTYTSNTVVIPVKLFQLYMFEPQIALVAAISTIFIGMTMLLVVGMRFYGITFYELGQK